MTSLVTVSQILDDLVHLPKLILDELRDQLYAFIRVGIVNQDRGSVGQYIIGVEVVDGQVVSGLELFPVGDLLDLCGGAFGVRRVSPTLRSAASVHCLRFSDQKG